MVVESTKEGGGGGEDDIWLHAYDDHYASINILPFF